jgi:hypothetical protein
MPDITITGKIAERLQQLARESHHSIEEILESALDNFVQQRPPMGSFARMALVARHNPIEVEPTDIADHSRDILRDEYAAYLLKRQQPSDD